MLRLSASYLLTVDDSVLLAITATRVRALFPVASEPSENVFEWCFYKTNALLEAFSLVAEYSHGIASLQTAK